MLPALLLLTLALHLLFVSGQWGTFRSPARKTWDTTWLELCASVCVLADLLLIFTRSDSRPAFDVAALVLIASSAALYGWAAVTVRGRPLWKAFSGNTSETLITRGPYRFIRNPFYAAYLLAHASSIPASQSLWAVFPFALMLLTYLSAIRSEEAALSAANFGEEYGLYMDRTGRLIPKLPWAAHEKSSPVKT